MKLPDGRVVQIEPDWFGKLSGITLLFEALVLARYPACSFCEAGSTDTPSGEITSNTVPPAESRPPGSMHSVPHIKC